MDDDLAHTTVRVESLDAAHGRQSYATMPGMAAPIDDPQDPRLADFAAADPQLRRREVEQAARDAGYLVVEGGFAVRRLIASGRQVRAVLVDATQHAALADVLDGLDAPVYLGTRGLIEATVGYAFHRGAIASADRDDGVEPAALFAGAGRIAVLEGVGDIENLGSIFRNAAAFGLDGVLLDPRTADPFGRRTIRVSMGHVLTTPWARARAWPAALTDARAAGFCVAALTPGDDAVPIDRLPLAGRIALLLGAEGPGLSTGALALADVRVRIPMAPGVDSLNVAAASAVAFHRVAKVDAPDAP
jgi:tRNA G18 (ribose-2'-O)-methylase SpoU